MIKKFKLQGKLTSFDGKFGSAYKVMSKSSGGTPVVLDINAYLSKIPQSEDLIKSVGNKVELSFETGENTIYTSINTKDSAVVHEIMSDDMHNVSVKKI